MDKYDQEIGDILQDYCIIKDDENVLDIFEDILNQNYWNEPQFLFQFTDRHLPEDNFKYGCLTQVKAKHARSPFFQNEIVADKRLHSGIFSIALDICENAKTYADVIEILWPYAEWQRKIDKEFERRNNDRLSTL